MKLSGIEKAAILMMALSEGNAEKVSRLLEQDEIKEISQAMANLGKISSESMEEVLNEFQKEISEVTSFVGNVKNTESFLSKILDKDQVENILKDIRAPSGRNVWDRLNNISEEALAAFLKNEYPQTAAFIVSKLAPQHAAKVMSLFSNEYALEVLKRMLKMEPIKQEVLERVEKTLKTEFITTITKTRKQDNNQLVAEIFNNFDRNNEEKFINMLESYDENAATQVKNLMFTFDDIAKIDPRGVQLILQNVNKEKLPVALKGSSDKVKDLILNNMSQRAAKILKEEIEGLGPVRIRDVDEAQASIINVTKDLLSKGQIELLDLEESEELIY